MEKSEEKIKPEKVSIDILLPHYVVEDLKDAAKFYDVNLNEVLIRAVLSYHAELMADLINGDLK